MRYAALTLALAACAAEPTTPLKPPRDNRVLQLMALVNPEAKCYPIATPMPDSPAPDTAYCAINQIVLWCEAPATQPPRCQKIGERQAEKVEPQVQPPPTSAPPVSVKKRGGAQ